MNQILTAAVAELQRLGHAALAALVEQIAGSPGQQPPSQWTNGMSQPDELGRVRLQAIAESKDVPPEQRNKLYFVREAATTFQLNEFQRYQILHNCGGTFSTPGSQYAFNPASGTRMAAEYREDIRRNWMGQESRVPNIVRALGDTVAFKSTVSLAEATDKALAFWRHQNSFTG